MLFDLFRQHCMSPLGDSFYGNDLQVCTSIDLSNTSKLTWKNKITSKIKKKKQKQALKIQM